MDGIAFIIGRLIKLNCRGIDAFGLITSGKPARDIQSKHIVIVFIEGNNAVPICIRVVEDVTIRNNHNFIPCRSSDYRLSPTRFTGIIYVISILIQPAIIIRVCTAHYSTVVPCCRNVRSFVHYDSVDIFCYGMLIEGLDFQPLWVDLIVGWIADSIVAKPCNRSSSENLR